MKPMAQGKADVQRRMQHKLRLAAVPLAAALASGGAAAAQLTATWQGAVGGNYATASAWDIGQVPLNDATNTYIVQILGSGRSVTYNTLNARTIDEFLLDGGSSFNLQAGSLVLPTQLTVLGRALIAGRVTVDRASFIALNPASAIVGDGASFSAINGGVIRIASPSYSAKGFLGGTIINAAGSGSEVELRGVQILDVGSPRVGGAYTNTVSASAGGVVNLASVRTVIAPASNADNLAFNVSSGGRLDLSSLERISGVTLDTGNTRFAVDGGTVALGPLQQMNRTFVTLANGSLMTAGGFAGSASLSTTTFAATNGSRLEAATLRGEYNGRAFNGATMLSAAGQGTKLDLSGIHTFDIGSARVGGAYTNSVAASDRAVIDLSGVRTVVAPSSNADYLLFSAISGASIDLRSLQEVAGLTIDTGNTSFSADAASFVLGPLQKANRMFVSLQNGATMSVGGYAGQAAITNSTFAVSGGSRLDAATLVGTYNARGLGGGSTLLSAAGLGSVMDLSGLRLFDSGSPRVGGAFSNLVSATDSALINLSGVNAIVAPASSADFLTFQVTTGGRINLAGLQDMAGLTLDTGNTRFSGDNGSFVLGPLQRASRWQVSLQNGATMDVGGWAGSAAISNSSFGLASGARLNGATLVGEYQVRAYTGATLMSATGAGTLMNLSGLHTLDLATPRIGGAYTNSISASDRATIDLSGVRTIVTPDSNADALAFNASSQGTIDLRGLQTVTSAGGGRLLFNASTGGGIVVGGRAYGPGTAFTLTDTGSSLGVAGSLTLLSGSTLSAAAGTRIGISGDYSFQQTAEAQVNTDFAIVTFAGSVAHTLEVGGRRGTSLPGNGSAVTANFAIGQLVLGDSSAEALTLVDAVDNGNRSSPEVLYLNGVGGENGLRIRAGSTLVLGGLDLYTTEGGSWVHINDRFVDGITTIAYDEGFISLTAVPVPEPRSLALLLAGLGVVAVRRRQQRGAEAA